jgi:hypothetical protein
MQCQHPQPYSNIAPFFKDRHDRTRSVGQQNDEGWRRQGQGVADGLASGRRRAASGTATKMPKKYKRAAMPS